MVNFRKQTLAVLFLAAVIALLNVAAPVLADDEEGDDVCISVDGSSCCPDSTGETENDGTLYCSKYAIAPSSDGKGITKTYDSGKTNTVWWLNIKSCEFNSNGLCHYDDSDDEDDDDDDEDDNDGDDDDSEEEGDDVCISTDGSSCCPDSTGQTENDGTLYCSKYTIAPSSDGKGITKTYPDGNTNTVWFINLDSCDPNSSGMCHFDQSDDINKSNENLADTPEAVPISVPEEDTPEAVPISAPEENGSTDTSTNGSKETSTPEAVPISAPEEEGSSANSIAGLASVAAAALAGFVGLLI